VAVNACTGGRAAAPPARRPRSVRPALNCRPPTGRRAVGRFVGRSAVSSRALSCPPRRARALLTIVGKCWRSALARRSRGGAVQLAARADSAAASPHARCSRRRAQHLAAHSNGARCNCPGRRRRARACAATSRLAGCDSTAALRSSPLAPGRFVTRRSGTCSTLALAADQHRVFLQSMGVVYSDGGICMPSPRSSSSPSKVCTASQRLGP